MLSDGHNRSINNAEWKVEITLHEFGHTADVAILKLCDAEAITPNDLRKVISARAPTRD